MPNQWSIKFLTGLGSLLLAKCFPQIFIVCCLIDFQVCRARAFCVIFFLLSVKSNDEYKKINN